MPQNNFGNSQLRLAVRLALGGGTLAASFGVANAQTTAATTATTTAAQDTTLQEVVVTGSRIAAPSCIP